ncbi:MAG: penicillin acylase family protein [Pseudomonadales bacterium]
MKKTVLVFFTLCSLAACVNQPQSSSVANGNVEIIRDEYGTAHVYGNTVYDVFYGYGYAVAQDRLFQMDMARRSAVGTVAEVLGADYADFDEQTRHLFSPQSIRDQLSALGEDDLAVFEGYAAGMNAWLARINEQRSTLLPLEFSEYDFEPGEWSAYDVAMVFVGTMVNRFGDYNTELDNARILSLLAKAHGAETAKSIFDDLNPRYTEGTPTSISSSDWQMPQVSNKASSHHLVSEYASTVQTSPSDIATGFSNCFVLGPDKASGANSILVNGPQFGWYVPAYVYSIGLHGAGFDIVGNTPFAYPVILFGHNADIAWGSTWGAGDIVDLFELTLNPENTDQYWYEGEYRDFEQRTETIAVLGSDSREITVRRSVHGQVTHFDAENGVAYAKRRAWDGTELQSMLAWMHSGRASTPQEWLEYADDAALNINWYYADRKGNIAYAFVGHYPERSAGADNRFPSNGDGSGNWGETQSFSKNPHKVNPESGYIANWNNKPAQGVLNPDEFWYSWSTADRVDYLHTAIDAQDKMTPEQAWDVVEGSSYGDINIRYFLPLIETAAQQHSNSSVRSAQQLLSAWDKHSRDADGDGFYDGPGTLLFQTFLQQLLKDVLEDDLGEAFPWFQTTGYPTEGAPTGSGVNISAGLKTLVEALNGRSRFDYLNGQTANQVVADTLKSVYDSLITDHGDDPADWQMANAPRPFTHKNFLGIPQTLESSAMLAPIEQNRGTENNMMLLQEDKIIGYEVVPPGNSGFISPQAEKDANFSNQFELYNKFQRKRLWFYRADVEANSVSSEKLNTR